jgi:hypothetical protein
VTTLRCRAALARLVVACLATLALALAACSGVNPSVSPSATVSGSSGTEPSASQSSSDSPSPNTAATPSVGPATASTAAANRAQTIHLILHPGGDWNVSVGSLTGCGHTICVGDYRLGDDPLFDATTGKQVGTLVYVEFLVRGASLFHSPGNTFDLTGRGQIVFSETLYDDGSGQPATGAILGGTGEFLGATGYVVSRSLQGSGDFVINITR